MVFCHQTQNRRSQEFQRTWCTDPSTSAVLEIRSTVPARMSRDSSSLCRILLRLLSRHRAFSIWKHAHTCHDAVFIQVTLPLHTVPPVSLCLWTAPAGCSPQPGCGHAPPPADAASGCTGRSRRPGRSERRRSERRNICNHLFHSGCALYTSIGVYIV